MDGTKSTETKKDVQARVLHHIPTSGSILHGVLLTRIFNFTHSICVPSILLALLKRNIVTLMSYFPILICNLYAY